MRRVPVVAAALMLVPDASAIAQRWADDMEGAETCRAIWREYGRNMSGDPRAVYCEIRDAGTLPRKETISVDGGERGGVRVRGESRGDIRVRLVVQAQGYTVDEAKELAQRVRLDTAGGTLGVAGIDRMSGRGRRQYVSAMIALDVPRQSNISARVDYAPLEVENVAGRMDLRASYGPLTLRDVGGEVRARVDHGPISVDLSGDKWQGAGLDAEAAYGPVTVRVPRNFGAELEIGARHGPLDIDFPLTLRRFDATNIQTTLGSGGPRVRAVAQYGPMALKMSR